MRIKAWVTGTAVEFTDDDGNYTEAHGWIDWDYDHHDMHESRNDVRPVAEWDSADEWYTEDHATADDFIRATLDSVLGAWEDGGNGYYYSVDEHMCNVSLQDGKSYSYTVHFTEKLYDAKRGWYEREVILGE